MILPFRSSFQSFKTGSVYITEMDQDMISVQQGFTLSNVEITQIQVYFSHPYTLISIRVV